MPTEEEAGRATATGRNPYEMERARLEHERKRGEAIEDTERRLQYEAQKAEMEKKPEFETKPTEERPSVEQMPPEVPTEQTPMTERELSKAARENLPMMPAATGRFPKKYNPDLILERKGTRLRKDEHGIYYFEPEPKPPSRLRRAFEGEKKRLREGPVGKKLTELEPLPSGEVAKRTLGFVGGRVARGFGAVGKGALIETNLKSRTTSTSVNPKGETVKTITSITEEKNPYSVDTITRTTEYTLKDNKWVLSKPTAVSSVSKQPVPTAQRRALTKANIESVLNGADILKEFQAVGGAKKGLLAPSAQGYRLNKRVAEREEKLKGNYPILPPRTRWSRALAAKKATLATAKSKVGTETRVEVEPETTTLRPSKATKSAAAKVTKVSALPTPEEVSQGAVTPTMISQAGLKPSQQLLAQARQTQATATQTAQRARSLTQAARAQAMKEFQESYTPERSSLGDLYRRDVRNYIGGYPQVVGFVRPREQEVAMAYPLAVAQSKMSIPTMVPTLLFAPEADKMNAFLNIGGFKHSVGPTHEVANQIFSPKYAMYQMAAGRRFGPVSNRYRINSDITGLFLGKGFKKTGFGKRVPARYTGRYPVRMDIMGLFTGRRMR